MILYKKNKLLINNWRNLLSMTIKQIDIANDIICPFGFEVLKDKSFLKRKLRRFYCYIGISRDSILNHDINYIENAISRKLLRNIKKSDPDFFNSIAIYKSNNQIKYFRPHGYICKKHDKLIHVKLIITDKSILDDYCNYTICTIGGIRDRNHPQIIEFNKKIISRTYIYQRFLMILNIFDNYLPSKFYIDKEIYNYLLLSDNSIQSFFKKRNESATKFDQEILNDLIYPLVDYITKRISLTNNNDKIIQITNKAYHGNIDITLNIAASIYLNSVNFVRDTYLQYSNN